MIMWLFNSKTLYDRYSKLMKLLMSIDSHFEVTENMTLEHDTRDRYSATHLSIRQLNKEYNRYK